MLFNTIEVSAVDFQTPTRRVLTQKLFLEFLNSTLVFDTRKCIVCLYGTQNILVMPLERISY